MRGTQGNEVDMQHHGVRRPRLALNAVQKPYTHLILAYFHYYQRPTYIRFKDSAPSDLKSNLPRISLTPRRRRVMLAELNQPELAHPRRPDRPRGAPEE